MKAKQSPKKYLGQHFLRSTKALSQIVDAASITASDIVLEIGPGEGVLTERLLGRAGKVIAVEKDQDLIVALKERFAEDIESGKLSIIRGDALQFDPELLRFYQDHTYKLVANIPYYITGAIIEKYLTHPYQPTTVVLLMQKEVAERIIARDYKESILSVAVKVYGTPKIVGRVPPGAFAPAPTVDSAVLQINNISREFFNDTDEVLFFSVLKSVFGKKRKQIGGSLSEYLENKDLAIQILTTASIDAKARPEDITLMQWKKLIQTLYQENIKKKKETVVQ